MSFFQYQNILGKPYQGFHSVRIGSFALFDIIGTIVIALLISYFLKVKSWLQLGFVILGTFIVGEICHYLFCVPTAFMRMI